MCVSECAQHLMLLLCVLLSELSLLHFVVVHSTLGQHADCMCAAQIAVCAHNQCAKLKALHAHPCGAWLKCCRLSSECCMCGVSVLSSVALPNKNQCSCLCSTLAVAQHFQLGVQAELHVWGVCLE